VPDSSSANGEVAHVDFTASASSTPLIFDNRLQAGGIALVRCRTQPNPTGKDMVSPQTVIAVPAGPAFNLDWRQPGGDRMDSRTIARGRVMVYPGDVPVWKRWHGSPSLFVMALDPTFVEETRQRVFEPSNGSHLRTLIGIDDPFADDLLRVAARELAGGGVHGRLFLESLATTLTVHLLQQCEAGKPVPSRHGGLAPTQLRRVLDHINVHLAEDLALSDLAAMAGLSPDHFGDAFKVTTGLAPYQYVIDRRISRARELLAQNRDLSVAEVALAVGFSSQSHLTTHFRRVAGITPARFRRSLT